MADAADLARTMLDIRRAGRTAVLTVQAHGVRTIIYFRDGSPIWAGEGAVERTLGRMLLKDGILDTEQYGAIIERMSEGLAQGKELRFGDVAIELGFLKREQVDTALREQARRKIMDCMSVEDGDIQIADDADQIATLPQHPPFDLEALIAAGIRMHWDDGRTSPLVKALADEKPTLRAEPGTLAKQLGLGLTDVALLTSIDGTRTTRDIVEKSPLGLDQAQRLFAALVVLDAVAFHARVTHPTTGPAAAKIAHPGAKPPPPPPQRPAARPAVPPPVPAAAKGPAPASGQPAAPPPPERMSQLPADVRRVRLEAEQLYRAGRVQFDSGKVFPAARKLRRAATLYPEAAEYALWAEWAEYKSERDPKQLAKKRARLGDAAVAALRQDKQLAMGHYVLGSMLVLAGDKETALRFLRRAVELDPKNDDAQQELEALLAAK